MIARFLRWLDGAITRWLTRDLNPSGYDMLTEREAMAVARRAAEAAEDAPALVESHRPTLLRLLLDDRPRVRNAAAEALWQIADTTAAPELQAALDREKHPEVRATIAHVLHVFGAL